MVRLKCLTLSNACLVSERKLDIQQTNRPCLNRLYIGLELPESEVVHVVNGAFAITHTVLILFIDVPLVNVIFTWNILPSWLPGNIFSIFFEICVRNLSCHMQWSTVNIANSVIIRGVHYNAANILIYLYHLLYEYSFVSYSNCFYTNLFGYFFVSFS